MLKNNYELSLSFTALDVQNTCEIGTGKYHLCFRKPGEGKKFTAITQEIWVIASEKLLPHMGRLYVLHWVPALLEAIGAIRERGGRGN